MKNLWHILLLASMLLCGCTKQKIQTEILGSKLGDSQESVKANLESQNYEIGTGKANIAESQNGDVMQIKNAHFAGQDFDEANFIFIDNKLSIVVLTSASHFASSTFETLRDKYRDKYKDLIQIDEENKLRIVDDSSEIQLIRSSEQFMGYSCVGVLYADKKYSELVEKLNAQI